MKSAGIFLVLLPLISGFKLEKAKDMPPVEEPAKLARWIIHNSCNNSILLVLELKRTKSNKHTYPDWKNTVVIR